MSIISVAGATSSKWHNALVPYNILQQQSVKWDVHKLVKQLPLYSPAASLLAWPLPVGAGFPVTPSADTVMTRVGIKLSNGLGGEHMRATVDSYYSFLHSAAGTPVFRVRGRRVYILSQA